MQQEIFKNLIDILNREIKLYTEMRDLYTEKRAVLVKNDMDALTNVDTRIVENYETIKKVDVLRLDAIRLISEDATCMTDLINIAQEKCPKFVSKLKEQQATLNSLSSSISVLNMTNISLIKHGMILTDKKLNIIIEACAPKGTSYSDKGTEETQNMEVSTIIRDV